MKSFLIVSALALFAIACSPKFMMPYQAPQQIDDGIEVGTLEAASLDSQFILEAAGRIYEGKHGEVHSMLILKDGLLVFEEYYRGHLFQWNAEHYHGEEIDFDLDTWHCTMSCTKSFMSACIGIAIKEGFIDNVNQSIFDYLPEHQHLKTDNRQYITIEHLVTMTCGLAWDEWSSAHGTAANDIDNLYFNCDDVITCVLGKPWWAVPGDYFTYNGGGMAVLGEIIRNSTNMNMDEFSKKYLFEPLNISKTYWNLFPDGSYDTAGSLKITPRAMLKLGMLYLNDGNWKGNQILDPEWIEKSSLSYRNNIDINIPGEDSGKNGYGYTWWNSTFERDGKQIDMYRAGGWGGQEIMVFPSLDMVVVFTGGNYDKNTTLYKLVRNYILPAINY